MNKPRYPEITVPLSEMDGNAMSIISRASKLARRSGCNANEVAEFRKEAIGGDYDNVIQTVMRWFDTE